MQTGSNVYALRPKGGAAAGEPPAPEPRRGRKSSRPMPWCKAWNGDSTAPIIRTIARRAGQPSALVSAVMRCLWDYANQQDVRGDVDGFDAEAIGDFFDVDASAVAAIVQALEDRQWIVAGRIATWEETQPAREDDSTIRVQKHREGKAVATHETPCNAKPGDGTPREEGEGDTDRESESKTPNESRPPAGDQIAFDAFWDAYPNKAGRPAAKKAFGPALKRAGAARIMDGLARYKASKPADRQWLNPATFLNQDRFDDQPTPAPTAEEADPVGMCIDPGSYGLNDYKMRRSAFIEKFGRFPQSMRWEPLDGGKGEIVGKKPKTFSF